MGDDVVDDPSAALLIRVWLEDSREFRARLLTLRGPTAELPAEEVTLAVTSSSADVVDAVRDWLEGFTRQAVHPVDGGR